MTLEEGIKDCVSKVLEDGTVERIVTEQLQKAIASAVESSMRCYGDVYKLIESKVKEMLVPAIEGYDFSQYVIKLDTVLSQIVNSTTLVDNKRILENFKELMKEDSLPKEMKASEVFKRWCKHVAQHVDTDGLEVDYDGEVAYEGVGVEMTVEHEERCNVSTVKYARILFTCEHDESLNFELRLFRLHDGDSWTVYHSVERLNIQALSHMSDFDVFLHNLVRLDCKLILDEGVMDDVVTPDKKPEANYS